MTVRFPNISNEDVSTILHSIRPNAQWLIAKRALIWLDETQTEPTQEEFDNAAELVLSRVRLDDAKSRVLAFTQKIAESITGPVPLSEQLGWVRKENAARAYMSNTASLSQLTMLASESQVTGETLEELCGKIIQKADRYALAVGFISGFRRKTIEALDALGPVVSQEQIEILLQQAQQSAMETYNDFMANT